MLLKYGCLLHYMCWFVVFEYVDATISWSDNATGKRVFFLI